MFTNYRDTDTSMKHPWQGPATLHAKRRQLACYFIDGFGEWGIPVHSQLPVVFNMGGTVWMLNVVLHDLVKEGSSNGKSWLTYQSYKTLTHLTPNLPPFSMVVLSHYPWSMPIETLRINL